MPHLTTVPLSPLSPDRFREVLPGDSWERFARVIESAREQLAGRVIWNINSTARGGGVAEMLQSLIAYARGAGVDARWQVLHGDDEFFRVTKRIHNRLHGAAGDGLPLDAAARAAYRRTCAANARALLRTVHPRDVVILHDPQTAGMAPALRAAAIPTVWRCHVGVDAPDDVVRSAWDFLREDVDAADAQVFSRVAFAWEGLDTTRVRVIQPSIDAFAPKNVDLSAETVRNVLAAAGIVDDDGASAPGLFTRWDGSPGRVDHAARMLEESRVGPDNPLVTQVSRWDVLKDPLGVMRGFLRGADADGTAHLVLAGPSVEAVADDPEGAAVLAEVERAWHLLPAASRRRVHLAALPMDDLEENAIIVNALQRRSDVVVQKSLAEGFGLTVAEAMWKGRAVVASRVGGIQDQVEHGVTGLLLDDPRDLDAFAAALATLLADPVAARAMGDEARRRVREHFLGARHLMDYAALTIELAR